MKQRFTFLLAMAALVGVSSCKKDKDAEPKSKTELLTAKKWRLTASVETITSGGMTITNDKYADMEACEKDDYIQFSTDKKVEFNEGSTKCDSDDPQSETGSWDFNSDESKLFFTDPEYGLGVLFDLTELNSTTMKLTRKVTFGSDTQTEVETFTAF